MLLKYYLKNSIALQILTHKMQFQLLHMLKNMLINFQVLKINMLIRLLDNLYIEVLEVVGFKHIKINSVLMVYKILILIMLNN
jgi:hypothetical protein